MKTVTVNRNELMKIVKANRATHASEFEQAKANYRGKVLEALDARRLAIANGDKIDLLFRLPEPQNHTDDYDRVISMLELSIDITIMLDTNEFDQYVRDNWVWSSAAKLINASYATAH